MSAATASSTETATVYVRLLDEGTDVWRPVEAVRLGQSTFRLSAALIPEGEVWSFQPGDIVVAEPRDGGIGSPSSLVAVARAGDIDTHSQRAASLAN